ncbi:outer membrane lipid asymmetry maintenance protein MlaD [Sodalis sp. CWE]|uniref:outer membrane lipid asymmetry maintenance protein MlaD n=1 Tax=Sodalis sp. CWE TaxID=2803816 RepID=UPI001C7D77C0|nr:outer membrane lipid asymmetry maintenance protein MlaD [Sodalis sp. CWE]MBX4180842.1 outer membrane lipid asymmetry maintenance protein MlaD [Sodalis sp. CWE]
MQTRRSEIWVGIFMIITFCAVIFLCLKVINIRSFCKKPTYQVIASFNNVGVLKVRSPVRIGGVVIGRVTSITLDPETYMPIVTMEIEKTYNQIPDSSSLAIRTSGLLGEQYLALNIGFNDPKISKSFLGDGSVIHDTKSTMALEDLIGLFVYKNSLLGGIP